MSKYTLLKRVVLMDAVAWRFSQLTAHPELEPVPYPWGPTACCVLEDNSIFSCQQIFVPKGRYDTTSILRCWHLDKDLKILGIADFDPAVTGSGTPGNDDIGCVSIGIHDNQVFIAIGGNFGGAGFITNRAGSMIVDCRGNVPKLVHAEPNTTELVLGDAFIGNSYYFDPRQNIIVIASETWSFYTGFGTSITVFEGSDGSVRGSLPLFNNWGSLSLAPNPGNAAEAVVMFYNDYFYVNLDDVSLIRHEVIDMGPLVESGGDLQAAYITSGSPYTSQGLYVGDEATRPTNPQYVRSVRDKFEQTDQSILDTYFTDTSQARPNVLNVTVEGGIEPDDFPTYDKYGWQYALRAWDYDRPRSEFTELLLPFPEDIDKETSDGLLAGSNGWGYNPRTGLIAAGFNILSESPIAGPGPWIQPAEREAGLLDPYSHEGQASWYDYGSGGGGPRISQSYAIKAINGSSNTWAGPSGPDDHSFGIRWDHPFGATAGLDGPDVAVGSLGKYPTRALPDYTSWNHGELRHYYPALTDTGWDLANVPPSVPGGSTVEYGTPHITKYRLVIKALSPLPVATLAWFDRTRKWDFGSGDETGRVTVSPLSGLRLCLWLLPDDVGMDAMDAAAVYPYPSLVDPVETDLSGGLHNYWQAIDPPGSAIVAALSTATLLHSWSPEELVAGIDDYTLELDLPAVGRYGHRHVRYAIGWNSMPTPLTPIGTPDWHNSVSATATPVSVERAPFATDGGGTTRAIQWGNFIKAEMYAKYLPAPYRVTPPPVSGDRVTPTIWLIQGPPDPDPYVRFNQRNDGKGVVQHPRLTAAQQAHAPRIADKHRYQ